MIVEFGALMSTTQVDWDELKKEVANDLELQQIKSSLGKQTGGNAGFQLQGKLFYKDRRVSPGT